MPFSFKVGAAEIVKQLEIIGTGAYGYVIKIHLFQTAKLACFFALKKGIKVGNPGLSPGLRCCCTSGGQCYNLGQFPSPL